MINRRVLYILLVPIFIMALATSSCDSGGDAENNGGVQGEIQKETVTIQGALSDVVVGSVDVKSRSKFVAFINNFITQIAHAQTTTVLEGILVEAFDDATDMENPVATDTTDENGEFTLEDVPCNTPLRLVFTHEDISVTLSGVSAPCPEGDETGILTMTFSIDFMEEEANTEDVDEQEELENAQISCLNGKQEQMDETDVLINGNGEACIITAGNCELEIYASTVILTGCSTCIDTRGNSSVEIYTSQFECDATEDGIRSVGMSEVEIEVLSAAQMADDTPDMAPIVQMNEDGSIVGSGNGDLLITAGEDGIDVRGNTDVELSSGVLEDDDDMMILVKEGEGGYILVEGGDIGIVAVGNSKAELEGVDCDVIGDTSSKGNAEIEIDCGVPSEDSDK